eukprot:5598884-Lingulodinium_polyedra.AAC.1
MPRAPGLQHPPGRAQVLARVGLSDGRNQGGRGRVANARVGELAELHRAVGEAVVEVLLLQVREPAASRGQQLTVVAGQG